MDKNALIAIGLSLLIIFAYYAFFAPPPPKKEASKVEKEQPAQPVQPPPVVEKPVRPPVTKEAPLPARKRIKVETARMTVLLDSREAGPVSWQLKEYLDRPGKQGKPMELLGPSPQTPDSIPLAVSLVDGQEPGLAVNFSTDADSQVLSSANKEAQVAFNSEMASGIKISKEYSFTYDKYAVPFTIGLSNGGDRTWTGRPVLTLSRNLITGDGKGPSLGYVAYGDGDVKRKSMGKAGQEDWSAQKLNWFGIDEQYFLVALLPQDAGEMKVRVEKREDGLLTAHLTGPALSLAPGETRALKYTLYFGPKDLEILKSVGAQLDKAIDFGWFEVVARPLQAILRYLYGVVGNYGWAIILLTVGIKIVFFPLTEKSFRSMQRMQKLQPLMAQLKEKYKDDKVKLNREVMDLYKRYKVNPMGGCLPMLIQLPVLYALYVVLMWGIELRHAPFILWIQDLSAKDPTYITPILMGGSMFIQQKMTPSMGDPMQAKMMLMMPVIFTVMFLNFPSGLVIYWLVNNVLSIGHQHYTNWRLRTVPEVVK